MGIIFTHKAFFDSLDLLFNNAAAKQYYIPAKRFGYLLMRIRNRYKDPTMEPGGQVSNTFSSDLTKTL